MSKAQQNATAATREAERFARAVEEAKVNLERLRMEAQHLGCQRGEARVAGDAVLDAIKTLIDEDEAHAMAGAILWTRLVEEGMYRGPQGASAEKEFVVRPRR